MGDVGALAIGTAMGLLAVTSNTQLLLVLNASPYHVNKQLTRYEVVRERIGKTGMSVVYANQVGGQDELVFDGASFALDAAGRLTHQFAAFEEALGFIDIENGVPVERVRRTGPGGPPDLRAVGATRPRASSVP